MENKEIIIPSFLHEIHGERSTWFNLIMTYSGGLIAASAVLIIYAASAMTLPYWKLVIMAIICADVGAGVIANFTKGTSQYYNGKKRSQIIFIFSHFIHPAIFLFVTELYSTTTIFLVLFIIVSTLVINGVGGREKQGVIAALCVTIGISLIFILNISNPLLLWFFPLFMVKLFLAFGIRRFT